MFSSGDRGPSVWGDVPQEEVNGAPHFFIFPSWKSSRELRPPPTRLPYVLRALVPFQMLWSLARVAAPLPHKLSRTLPGLFQVEPSVDGSHVIDGDGISPPAVGSGWKRGRSRAAAAFLGHNRGREAFRPPETPGLIGTCGYVRWCVSGFSLRLFVANSLQRLNSNVSRPIFSLFLSFSLTLSLSFSRFPSCFTVRALKPGWKASWEIAALQHA